MGMKGDEGCCRTAHASFDRLRMRFFLCGPWAVPDSIFLILSLSKDAQRQSNICDALHAPQG
jgi:hypothetical protein